MARSSKGRSGKTSPAGIEDAEIVGGPDKPEETPAPDSPQENPDRPPEPNEVPEPAPQEAPDLDPDALPESPPEETPAEESPIEIPGETGPSEEAPATPSELPPSPSEVPGPGHIPGSPGEQPPGAPDEIPPPPDETDSLGVAERAAVADWGRTPPDEVIAEAKAEEEPPAADAPPAAPVDEPEEEQAAPVASSVPTARKAPSESTPPAAEPAPRETPAAPPARRGGFVALVLGGVVAAALGYGAHWYLTEQSAGDRESEIAALQTRIDDLQAELGALPPPPEEPDLAPLQTAIDSNSTAMDELRADLSGQIEALGTRIDEVERAPSADGTLTQTALESWQAELDSVRAEIADQQERFGALADDAAQRMQEAQDQAAEVQAAAEASAARATSLAGLSRIQSALEAGAPYEAALAEFQNVYSGDIPPALAEAAPEGVPTLSELRETYPAAARAGLATAREEGLSGEEGNRFTAFMRNQFAVRSTQPRDGDAPDAILSRAEAALEDGRLNDALAELNTLPEVVRASMTEWLAAADLRARALAGAEAVVAEINAGETAAEGE
ncbi:hypothetical protein ACXN5S_01820 [Pseudoroseicyclus sp. H15]